MQRRLKLVWGELMLLVFFQLFVVSLRSARDAEDAGVDVQAVVACAARYTNWMPRKRLRGATPRQSGVLKLHGVH